MNKLKYIIIGGPTSTNKTNLALYLAKNINGEIVNADSRQIYNYLNIGTNKGNVKKNNNIWEIDNIPIHLINLINPNQQFNVFEYKQLAQEKILKINKNNKIAILVGGTGLYIDSILKNYSLTNEIILPLQEQDKINHTIEELGKLNIKELQTNIKKINNAKFLTLNLSDQNNPRRLIRIAQKTITDQYYLNKNNIVINDKKNHVKEVNEWSLLKVETLFLYPKYTWEHLKEKITNRVEQMFEEGIIEEVQLVLKLGLSKDLTSLQGIGYKEIIKYLSHEYSLEKCIELIKIAHVQYAKRQRTWFEGKNRKYKLNIYNTSNEYLKEVKNFVS